MFIVHITCLLILLQSGFILAEIIVQSSTKLDSDGFSGGEIIGLNLEAITDEEFDIVHENLLKYKVLVIRNQSTLSIEGQRSFSKRFGKLHVHLESSSHIPNYPDVNLVSNVKNSTGGYIGLHGAHVETFHSDLAWCELPTKVTIVRSALRPDGCGNTEFLNTHAAYYGLPDEIKERSRNKTAKYCYLKQRKVRDDGVVEDGLTVEEALRAAKCVTHPVISMHPITGFKNIYVDQSHAKSIDGEPDNTLLDYLLEHSRKPEYTYTHVWRDGDVVLWDNRGTQPVDYC